MADRTAYANAALAVQSGTATAEQRELNDRNARNAGSGGSNGQMARDAQQGKLNK